MTSEAQGGWMARRGTARERRRGRADLHLDIQDTHTTLVRYVLDRFDAGAVVIAAKLGVLDEAAGIDQRQERFLAGEVVVPPVLFVGAGGACRIYQTIRLSRRRWTMDDV